MKPNAMYIKMALKLSRYILVAVLMFPVSALVHQAAFAQSAEEISDPFEGVNRYTFEFNDVVDRFILRPVAEAYDYVLPRQGKDSIRNVLRNLRGPLIFVNQLLQGEVTLAGDTLARFLLNSTFGLVGIFDIGPDFGLPYRDADFGQTFGKWGIPSGPYIVLPILGPSSARDTVGTVADYYGDPVNIALWSATDSDDDTASIVSVSRAVVGAVDTRARLLRTVDDLKKNSLDYYATVRSIYSQRRAAEIQGKGAVNVPSYGAN